MDEMLKFEQREEKVYTYEQALQRYGVSFPSNACSTPTLLSFK